MEKILDEEVEDAVNKLTVNWDLRTKKNWLRRSWTRQHILLKTVSMILTHMNETEWMKIGFEYEKKNYEKCHLDVSAPSYMVLGKFPPGKFHPGIFLQGMFPPDMFPI